MADTALKAGEGRADRWVAAWMAWVTARPRAVLIGLVALVLAAGLAAARLGVDADSSRMLSPDLPAQERALALNAAFPTIKNTLVVVIQGETADQADIATAELYAAVAAKPGLLQHPFATSVDPFFAANGFLYRDLDSVEAMFTRITKSANVLAGLRGDPTVDGFARALDDAARLTEGAEISAEALDRLYAEAARVLEAQAEGTSRPFGWSAVLDDEADPGPTTRVLTVEPVLDARRLSPAKPALLALQEAIASLPAETTRGVQIAVTGDPALRAEELQSVVGTIGISLALSLVLVALSLRIGLRSTGRAALAFASLLVALAVTTGFAAIAIGKLNLVSVAFIVLMVGLGIDFAIHILAHIAEMRGQGTALRDSVTLTGRRCGLALVLSAVTTSFAFLAFATTDFLGMAQLGLIGGFGVLAAFGVAATLIPAAIALRPGLAGEVCPSGAPTATAARGGSTAVAVAVLVLGAVAILPATQARFDADPMGLRDPGAASVRAFNVLAADAERSPYRASVLVPTREMAEDTATRFANEPGIGAAISISDLIPDLQDDKLTFLDFAAPSIDHAVGGTATDLGGGGDGDPVLALADRVQGQDGPAGRLGTALDAYLASRDTASDAVLQEALFRTFPLMLDRLGAMLEADYVTQDALPEVMRLRFVNAAGDHRVEILPETPLLDPADVAAFAETVSRIEAEAAGGPVQFAAAGRSVSQAMLSATALAALATILLAFFATRRAVDTAAIVLPLVVAGILTAAASVLLDMPFNYANVIVLPLLIGIGVDSGIHIALRERRAPGAVYATSTPRAVLFSALTTTAAFGTLALSDHRGTASMGVLLAVAMIAAMGSILALTPALIRWAQQDA